MSNKRCHSNKPLPFRWTLITIRERIKIPSKMCRLTVAYTYTSYDKISIIIIRIREIKKFRNFGANIETQCTELLQNMPLLFLFYLTCYQCNATELIRLMLSFGRVKLQRTPIAPKVDNKLCNNTQTVSYKTRIRFPIMPYRCITEKC